jgi:uncharacterized membrane protein (DUF106 family)
MQLQRIAIAVLAAAILVSSVATTAGQYYSSDREVRRELREGRREIARERRELRRDLMRADTPWEARQAIREGMREIRREQREMRREVRREIRERW